MSKIEDKLAELGLELDTLFYDTTNFFTFIDSTNTRCTVAKRGHSKQKRFDLRIFGQWWPVRAWEYGSSRIRRRKCGAGLGRPQFGRRAPLAQGSA